MRVSLDSQMPALIDASRQRELQQQVQLAAAVLLLQVKAVCTSVRAAAQQCACSRTGDDNAFEPDRAAAV
jgi:hypothetical protein